MLIRLKKSLFGSLVLLASIFSACTSPIESPEKDTDDTITNKPSQANISSITFSKEVTLSPAFSNDIFNYTIYLKSGETELTDCQISVQSESSDDTYQIFYSCNTPSKISKKNTTNSSITCTLQKKDTITIINNNSDGSKEKTFNFIVETSTTITPTTSLTGTLNKPTNFKIGSYTSGRNIYLEWEDDNTNEKEFIIERSLSGSGPFVEVERIPAVNRNEQNVWTIESNMLPGTYYYKVKASNESGTSEYADEIPSHKVLVYPIEQIKNLSVLINVKDDGTVVDGHCFYWDAISFSNKNADVIESGYEIYRKKGTGDYVLASRINATEITTSRAGVLIPGNYLTLGFVYRYAVRAYYVVKDPVTNENIYSCGDMVYDIGNYSK